MKTFQMRKLTLALALVAVLGMAGMANAQMGGHGIAGGAHMGMTGVGMAGLPPEQQAAVQKIYSDNYAATAQFRQQLLVKQSELNAQIYGGAADEKKIQTLTKEIGDINSKLYEAQVNLRKQLAREGVPASGMGMNCGMMGGGMGGMGGMMGGGMGHGGMGY